ncbi:hypothetical protein ACQ4PT_063790 [Festuca glaucescens]
MSACLRPLESCFLVTELLSGAMLGEWLHGGKERPPGSLPPLKESEQALEIALAMRYLHLQTPWVLHQDPKPSNMLLDCDLRAWVADYGHARFLPDGTEALTGVTGTYCEPYTKKSDMYSFGVN